MESMTQGLLGQLQGRPMSLIGQRLGLSQGQAASAVTERLEDLAGRLEAAA